MREEDETETGCDCSEPLTVSLLLCQVLHGLADVSHSLAVMFDSLAHDMHASHNYRLDKREAREMNDILEHVSTD